jgi:hypothetical protein
MALTANRDVKFFASQELLDLPVRNNKLIYKGAFVGVDPTTGYVRPLIAGDAFAGLAYRQADNTGPNHANGAITARLHQQIDIVHLLVGVTQDRLGSAVYATADDTLTLSASGASRVGTLVGIEGTNLARVRLEPFNG